MGHLNPKNIWPDLLCIYTFRKSKRKDNLLIFLLFKIQFWIISTGDFFPNFFFVLVFINDKLGFKFCPEGQKFLESKQHLLNKN